MKVLIVSDTHKRDADFYDVLDKVGPVDMVIHCGDGEGSEYEYEQIVSCPVHMVAGNNDFFTGLPKDLEVMVGEYRVWITHGHQYYVSMSNEVLKGEAIDRGVDIVFYGHTHRPVIDISEEVIAVNPGSISYPRQEGRQGSYVLMDIDRDGEAHFTLRYVE